MTKVLVSAFEPFDGMDTNPSQNVLESLQESEHLKKCLLPVSFEHAFPRLKAHIKEYSPDVVICLGLAKNRSVVTLERVAINWIETKISDNDGYTPEKGYICSNEDLAYFSSLPLDKMILATKKEAYPAMISHSAGTYVCNQIMYLLLRETKLTSIQAGFIHVPTTVELDKSIAKMAQEEVLLQIKKIILSLSS